MDRLPKVQPGDPITAEAYNRLATLLERAVNLRVAAPLALAPGPRGQQLRLNLKKSILARLGAEVQPGVYAWDEVFDAPSKGFPSIGGARHADAGGGSLAYEVNGGRSLSNAVVELWPVANAWNAFQVPRMGGGCKLCVSVEDCGGPASGDAYSVTAIADNGLGKVYGPCSPTGQVVSVIVSKGGSGYDPEDPPSVSFAGGGGSGASGVAVLTGGGVSEINVTDGGSGFTSVPTVTISAGGSGSGATAVAVLTPTPLASLTIVAAGSGYTAPPNPKFSTSAGSGAVASTTLGLVSVQLSSGGAGYNDGIGYPLALTGGGGSGAAGLFDVLGGAVINPRMTAMGSGYTSPPDVSFAAGGPGTGATANALMGVATLDLTSGGSYSNIPAVTFRGGGGGGATATAALTPTSVASISLSSTGKLYSLGSPPTVTITGGGGTGATANALIANVVVSGVTVTDGGEGYTSAPGVVISGGSGSGAVATATIAFQCCLNVPSGVYEVVATGPCDSVTVKDVVMQCPRPGQITVTLPPGVITVIQNPATGTCNPTARLPVTIPTCINHDGDYTVTFGSNPCLESHDPVTVTVKDCKGTVTIDLVDALYPLTVEVFGCCGLPLPGATVTVEGPGGGGGSTTGPDGTVVIPGITAGCQYTITASKALFAASTRVYTMPCGEGSRRFDLAIDPTIVADYACTGCCPDPIKRTVTIASDLGTATITCPYVPGASDCTTAFTGCQIADPRDVACLTGFGDFNGIAPCVDGGTSTGSIALYWVWTPCSSLTVMWSCCDSGTGFVAAAGACTPKGSPFPFPIFTTSAPGCEFPTFNGTFVCQLTAFATGNATCLPLHEVYTFPAGPPVTMATIAES